MMRNIILVGALLMLFAGLLLWGGGVEEPTELVALSRLADEMMKELQAGDVEALSHTLDEIQAKIDTYPAYLYPQERLPSYVSEQVKKVKRQLWLHKTETAPIEEDAFILYTLMDGLTHPYQPVWLEMLKTWEGKRIPAKQYAYIRPAMLLTLPDDQIQRFDRYFIDSSNDDPLLYHALVREAMDETQARWILHSKDLFFLLFLLLITALTFIALRMRIMSGGDHESGFYWHQG